MGTACDMFGPRLASAALTLLTAPAVYFTLLASSPDSFLLVSGPFTTTMPLLPDISNGESYCITRISGDV
ncbi:hypothetical protein LINPERPRIM_LOCUS37634 [Linum perenne]